MTDLKSALLDKLVGSSSLKPVDTDILVSGHHRSRVEAALMALYADKKIYCCKIIKGGHERVVWWQSGIVEYTGYYGKINISPVAAAKAGYVEVKKEFKPRKRSEFTVNLLDHITVNPGLLLGEIIKEFSHVSANKVSETIGTLRHCKQIRVEGTRRHFRYYPNITGEINGHQ